MHGPGMPPNQIDLEIINRLQALIDKPDFQILAKDRLQNLSLNQKLGSGMDGLPASGVLCDFFSKSGNAVVVSVHVDVLPDYAKLIGAEPQVMSDILLKLTWGTAQGNNTAEVSAGRGVSFSIACQALRIEAFQQRHIDFFGPPGATVVPTVVTCALGVGTVFNEEPIYRALLVNAPAFRSNIFPVPKYANRILVQRLAVTPSRLPLPPLQIFEYMNQTVDPGTLLNETDIAAATQMVTPLTLNPATQFIQLVSDQAFTATAIFFLSL